jgi:hypothetical protein
MGGDGLRYGSKGVLRRLTLALLGAVFLGAPMLTGASAAAAPVSSTESANPINDQGSSYHYRSEITSVTPRVHGLSLQVLEFADRMLLTNHTGRTVTIYGYQGEPYARVLANGTAEQNVRSPATYLNTNFYGDVTVPPIANPSESPQWEVVDRTGQFEWHDHRIHWMSPVTPPQVKNKSKLTLVFDWKVPIAVGTRMGTIEGRLLWTPESSKAPVAVIVLGVVILVGGLALVLFVRRRRALASYAGGGGAATGGPGGSAKEAW